MIRLILISILIIILFITLAALTNARVTGNSEGEPVFGGADISPNFSKVVRDIEKREKELSRDIDSIWHG